MGLLKPSSSGVIALQSFFSYLHYSMIMLSFYKYPDRIIPLYNGQPDDPEAVCDAEALVVGLVMKVLPVEGVDEVEQGSQQHKRPHKHGPENRLKILHAW